MAFVPRAAACDSLGLLAAAAHAPGQPRPLQARARRRGPGPADPGYRANAPDAAPCGCGARRAASSSQPPPIAI